MGEPLAVVLYTHMRHEARLKYASRALTSLSSRLKYSGPIHLHIADDSSPTERLEALTAHARKVGFDPSVTIAGGRGYGGSYNAATGRLHTDYDLYLCVEDDWELTRDVDADHYAAVLQERGSISCIRLGYIGWATGTFRGTLVSAQSEVYFLFDPESTEQHVFSGHPRFETREFQRRVGLWPENLDAGATEWTVAGRKEAREGVAWRIGDEPHHIFGHIGTVQAREDQHGD